MRLLQQRPAWAHHAHLRFNGRDYESENCVSNQALGQQLPLLADDSYLISADKFFSYTRRASENDSSTCQDQAFCDNLLAHHLQQTLSVSFKTLTDLNGDTKNLHESSAPLLIGLILGKVVDMQVAINGTVGLPRTLINDIKQEYDRVELLLKKCHRRPLGACVTVESVAPPRKPAGATGLQYGAADAVLFGHIADALCNRHLSVIVQEYEYIMQFFSDICQYFFAVAYGENAEDVPSSWKDASDSLLASWYLSADESGLVKRFISGEHQYKMIVEPSSAVHVPAPLTPPRKGTVAVPPGSTTKTPSHHDVNNPKVIAHAGGGVTTTPAPRYKAEGLDMAGVYGSGGQEGAISPSTKEINRMSLEFVSPPKMTSPVRGNGGDFRSPANPKSMSKTAAKSANKSVGFIGSRIDHHGTENADSISKMPSVILDMPTRFVDSFVLSTDLRFWRSNASVAATIPSIGTDANATELKHEATVVSIQGLMYMGCVLGFFVKYFIDSA